LSVGGYFSNSCFQGGLGKGIDGEDGRAEESEEDDERTHYFEFNICRGGGG